MAFSTETFGLLEAISRTPTAAFYLAHKADFKLHVEEPLQAVVRREVELLPALMRERLETRRNLFSRFLKNDFGRGGAWANYWGAFYPRGSRRVADVQLAVWLDARRVGISFTIGDYAALPRQRFERNCARYAQELPGLLEGLFAQTQIQRARDGRITFAADGRAVPEEPLSWEEWLADPRSGEFWAFLSLTPPEALQMSTNDLAALAAHTHALLFPLALLAMQEEPLGIVRAFI